MFYGIVGIAQAQNSTQPDTKKSEAARSLVADRPHQVGYRRQDFKFATASGEQRTRQLDLWYPTQEREQRHEYKGPFGIKGQVGFAKEGAAVASGEHPLLLFSHGFLGTSDQTIFLTEACARAGYIVASMNHADSIGTRRRGKQKPPKFADYANWTDDKYRDRQEDLTALLNQMLEWNKAKESPWSGRIDEALIGGCGHSLGGYTVMGMAGGWKSWKEPRIKAAVLLSPYAHPFDAQGKASDVTIPVMLQGGTLDFGITPFLTPVYQKLSGPKVLLVLKNETHFGWTNLISLGKTTTECVADGNAELMVKYTIAFFDQHLLDVDRSAVLEKGNSRLESYRFESKSKTEQP
ncbi:MAG: hypothetical protein IAG10_12735 [Planctomycetaceae bacterium]|nr:hypothetical protein [Planctomycetaceae bacterium]